MWRRVFQGSADRGGLAVPAALLALLAVCAAPAAALEMKPEKIERDYRQVLGVLSAGDETEAIRLLMDLETKALGDLPGTMEMQRFWKLKLGVIRELLQAGQLDQLVPIIVLHHDVYQMYHDQGLGLLASHSRTMAAELAEILGDRSSDDAVRAFSAGVLTSIGSYLLDTRSLSEGAATYVKALAMTPGNIGARLGLAAAHEKRGEYEEAMAHLEAALSSEPEQQQARLRLAVCLQRLGRAEEAGKHFRALLEPGVEEWIRSLAFQEQAKLLFASGRGDEGEALLRHAIIELPGHQQPAVLLAAHLELSRRRHEAQEVLAAIEPSDLSASSPRYVYDTWPHVGVAEVRSAMHEMMRSRLAVLAAGLRGVRSGP